jgi:hypothetical protein
MAKEYRPLRDWSCPSYSSTGRQASPTRAAGRGFNPDGFRVRPSSQVEAAHGRAGKGAPSLSSGWTQDGASDKGRRKWGGSTPS